MSIKKTINPKNRSNYVEGSDTYPSNLMSWYENIETKINNSKTYDDFINVILTDEGTSWFKDTTKEKISQLVIKRVILFNEKKF